MATKIQGEDLGKAIDAILTFAERKKAQSKIEKAIKDAEGKGHKIEYKIDPQTGAVTPVITANTSGQYDEMFKEMIKSGQYEVSGMTAGGKPRLAKKKKYKPEDLVQAKMLLQYGADRPIDMRIGQQDVRLDMNNPKDIEKGMNLAYGENWREDSELIEAGMPQLYDERMRTLGEKQQQMQVQTEQPIQPYATGLGRMGSMGAAYQDATKQYGEQKTAQVVDGMIKLQKQGMTYEQIGEILKKKGYDPNLFLSAYYKQGNM